MQAKSKQRAILDEAGKRGELQLKKGDRVLFTSYAGTEVKFGGEDFLILTEDDVLAIVE